MPRNESRTPPPVCESSSCQSGPVEAGSGVVALLHSSVTQLMKNGSQDCFQGRVQRLVLHWGTVNLERAEETDSCIQNTHRNIFNLHLMLMLTLVNTFIVWLRKLVSTSSGIGRRWAAQSRIHSKVSLWPCQWEREQRVSHNIFRFLWKPITVSHKSYEQKAVQWQAKWWHWFQTVFYRSILGSYVS